MHIAIVNQSSDLAGKSSDIDWMIWAWKAQLVEDVMPIWGYMDIDMYQLADPTKITPGHYQMLLTSTPDVANALGYHSVDPHNGLPYGKVFTGPIFQNGGTIRQGANSVSVTGSHEFCELFGDQGANLYAMDINGVGHAVELCDFGEQYSYDKTSNGVSVSVSNFARPEWFRSVSEDNKFDFMGLCTQSFQVLSGGYDITLQNGQIQQIFGREYWEWKKPLKTLPHSRTTRRMHHAKKILASLQKAA